MSTFIGNDLWTWKVVKFNGVDVKLVLVNLANCGMVIAKTKEVYEKMIRGGFRLCPSELGQVLLPHYMAEHKGYGHMLAMEPVDGRVLFLGRRSKIKPGQDELYMGTVPCGLDTIWIRALGDRPCWIFIKP